MSRNRHTSAKPMRIGYDTLIENPLAPSSAIDFLQHLLHSMAAADPQNEIFVFVSPKNRRLFESALPNIHLVNCFFSNENIPFRILVQQLYYPLLALRYRLDVIFALNQIPLLSPCGTVVKICTLHHRIATEEFKKTPWRSNWLRMYYRQWMIDASARKAEFVIANSSVTREGILQTMGVADSKVRTVYEAVDDRFGGIAVDEARQRIRQEVGVSRDYILYASSLWYYKNPEGAIRGFARMREKYGTDLDLLVTGSDDYARAPELMALARELGVENHVRILGKVPIEQLVALYRAARVCFYPSLAETFGKPIVEAMKSGVPLVTSNVSCLPEIAGRAALLVDPLNADAMADALHCAATNPETRAQLIADGTRRAEIFTWQKAAEHTLSVCREASTRESRRPVSATVGDERP